MPYMLRLKNKKKELAKQNCKKVKPKLMEFYEVETINGKSNNIGTYEVFW
jgi:hypothetical protein